ncbi:SDR family oxidoreductase [Microcoleus sp. CZ3-B4]|uniref:SDR family oxidoreductase n=1 Tax=Microcoleus sp. CZ3-B4 TaxID=2818733 RepID=UPI002FD66886
MQNNKYYISFMSYLPEMYYRTGWLVGASGGIGSVMAILLGKRCDKVFLVDKVNLSNKNLVKFSQPQFEFYQLDAANEQSFLEFANLSSKSQGLPEVLVIAAGTVFSKPLQETDLSTVDNLYKNNFRVATVVLQSFYQHCSHDPSHPKSIVIVSSNAGTVVRPNQPVYAAFKSAINSLARSLALSWGYLNIRINVIAPGTVWVERNDSSLREKFPDFPEDPKRPLGRIALPEDLNHALDFLIHPQSLVTGQIITVDGGSSLATN